MSKVSLAELDSSQASDGALLVANLNAFVLDYLARQKIGGTDIALHYFRQFPILPHSRYTEPVRFLKGEDSSLRNWINCRVLELVYNHWGLTHFADDLGWEGPPFRWDDSRRTLLRAELDACFFHLYGIERDDVDYIMDTFPIVRRHDERQHGEYRTKRLILEVYDAMAKAAETGEPYKTILDPPPADPSCAHPESTRPVWAT